MKRLLFAISLTAMGVMCLRPATAQLTTQTNLRTNQWVACKAPTCVFRWTCRCDLHDQY